MPVAVREAVSDGDKVRDGELDAVGDCDGLLVFDAVPENDPV